MNACTFLVVFNTENAFSYQFCMREGTGVLLQ